MSSMRESMPQTAAWIDDLRAAFGAESVNGSIRAGLGGMPTFYAEEAGHQLGTPATIADPQSCVMVGEVQWAEGTPT